MILGKPARGSCPGVRRTSLSWAESTGRAGRRGRWPPVWQPRVYKRWWTATGLGRRPQSWLGGSRSARAASSAFSAVRGAGSVAYLQTADRPASRRRSYTDWIGAPSKAAYELSHRSRGTANRSTRCSRQDPPPQRLPQVTPLAIALRLSSVLGNFWWRAVRREVRTLDIQTQVVWQGSFPRRWDDRAGGLFRWSV